MFFLALPLPVGFAVDSHCV